MATDRKQVLSGSPYESVVGFSRGTRAGKFIAISGTAAIGPDGKTVGIGNAEAQARHCLNIIKNALVELGAGLEHVYRTRTILTNINDWDAVARVHGEFFGDVKPANTIMQVSRFIDPDWLVEFEADALLED